MQEELKRIDTRVKEKRAIVAEQLRYSVSWLLQRLRGDSQTTIFVCVRVGACGSQLVSATEACKRPLRVGTGPVTKRDAQGRYPWCGQLAHVAYYAVPLSRTRIVAHAQRGKESNMRESERLFAMAANRYSVALSWAPDDPVILSRVSARAIVCGGGAPTTVTIGENLRGAVCDEPVCRHERPRAADESFLEGL